jgi:hypothetical protein
MHWSILVGVAISVFIVFAVLIYLYVIKPKDSSTTTTTTIEISPVPSQARQPVPRTGRSSIPVGVKPNFAPVKTLDAVNNVTFNYVNSPMQNGSTGYLLYNNKSNMLDWGFSMPLNFTHARMSGGRIFEFENPNSSNTYGIFVNEYGDKITTPISNFFTSSIELGTFF